MRLILVSALASLLALACSGLATDSPAPNGAPGGNSPHVSVTLQDYSFIPPVLTIQAGTIVNWSNKGPSSHSVTSDTTGQFDSGALAAPMGNGYGGMTNGGTFQVTFAVPGDYKYHCMFHPSMHGTITVH